MDLDKIIDNVAEVLKETPSAVSTVKQDGKKDQRYRELAAYMVRKAIKHDALILSENQKGVAILFEHQKGESNQFKDSIKEQINLLFKVTGLKNALRIIKNQKVVKEQRPDDEAYLYCWFWGIAKDDRGAETQVAREMKDELMRIADEKQLPLYAETRTKRNVIVYRRYGFEMFKEWEHPEGGHMWFLKYEPKKNTEE